jgi:hypothetical protein
MLLDLLAGRRAVSIIGLTKNTGKTTTFNHLVRQSHAAGTALGLTSIGRNGERWDSVTRERKPLIWAPKGAWIATAEAALAKSRVQLRQTSEVMGSSFGSILLGEVVEAGYLELIGPQTSNGVRHVTAQLRESGADLVLVDGTFGRRFTAAAALSDGLVIATGATAGNNFTAVVERTRFLVSLFRLPTPAEVLRPAIQAALESEHVTTLSAAGDATRLPFTTALGHEAAIARIVAATHPEALVLPGALTNELATALTELGGPLQVMVTDPACLMLDAPHLRRMTDAGIRLHPLHATPLLAVTVNPYKGKGKYLPADELQQALTEAIAPVPVVNVALEGAILTDSANEAVA